VFNAANEVAVGAFLSREVRFPEMADVVAHALEVVPRRNVVTVNDVLQADSAARHAAREFVSSPPSMARG
jgi:1-deoxy-D-xylulose-5-phosphate reductoisomerase